MENKRSMIRARIMLEAFSKGKITEQELREYLLAILNEKKDDELVYGGEQVFREEVLAGLDGLSLLLKYFEGSSKQ